MIFTRENPGEIGCLAFGEGDSQPVTEGRRKEKQEGRLSRGPELSVEGVGGVRSSADAKEKEARALGRERELGRARGAGALAVQAAYWPSLGRERGEKIDQGDSWAGVFLFFLIFFSVFFS